MDRVNDYLQAAERENTRKSYASALRHYEEQWKGLLPATGDAIARYLSEYAPTLSLNTLKQRLSAISRWHTDHGFPDPTRGPIVRQVMKGIRAVHGAQEKRAQPLQLATLQQVDDWHGRQIESARRQQDPKKLLRYTRDRALILLGFWRGFRADELVNLRIENVEATPGEGLVCYLPRSKGDRQLEGRTFQCPALSRLCAVSAYVAWIEASALEEGPVFRKIDQWGRLSSEGLGSSSLIPMLRKILADAGVENPGDFTSHSLRRGFAGWADANGWDLKNLMEYVGWRDIKSAMRYLDANVSGLQARFEQGLPSVPSTVTPQPQALASSKAEPVQPAEVAMVRVTLSLSPFSKGGRGVTQARRLIEKMCLERYAPKRLDKTGNEYELEVPYPSRDELDETIYALLDEMHRIADDNRCFLELTLHEPAADTYWD